MRIDTVHSDLNKLAEIERIAEMTLLKFRVEAALILQTLTCANGAKVEEEIDRRFGPKGAVFDELNDALYDIKTALQEEADEYDHHVSMSERAAVGLAAE